MKYQIFSTHSHIIILFPRNITLPKSFVSFPLCSTALSKTIFMKWSKPIMLPEILRLPLSLILSRLSTYLRRSGPYPCLLAIFLLNIVLDHALEHRGKETKDIGKVMLRGNNIIMWECTEKM